MSLKPAKATRFYTSFPTRKRPGGFVAATNADKRDITDPSKPWKAKGKTRIILSPTHAGLLYLHEGVYYLYNSNDSDGELQDDGLENVTGVIRPLLERDVGTLGSLHSMCEGHPDFEAVEAIIGKGKGKCYGISQRIWAFLDRYLAAGYTLEEANADLCTIRTLDFFALNL